MLIFHYCSIIPHYVLYTFISCFYSISCSFFMYHDIHFVDLLCRHKTQIILNQRERHLKEKDHIAKDSFSLFQKCQFIYLVCKSNSKTHQSSNKMISSRKFYDFLQSKIEIRCERQSSKICLFK